MAKDNAIEVFATQLDVTYSDCAGLVGVNERTIKNWVKDPEFVEAIYDRYMVEFGRQLPKVLSAMVREAVQGNVAAGRLVLEHSGKLVKNINVTVDSPFEKFMRKMGDIEDAEVVDGEIMDDVDDLVVQMALPERKVESSYSRARKENNIVAQIQTMSEKTELDRQEYNKRQREWYAWRKRADAVGVPMLKAKKPTLTQRSEWEAEIIKRESTQ